MLPECLIGNFIKHKHAKDVCYFVRKVSRLNGDYRYDLAIWNMGFEKSWQIQTCKAENIDLDNFMMYPDTTDCLRYVEWKEIK